ncbi:MAG: diaminopimelate epimerase, partial [Fusobacteriaceae bacterium]
FIYENKILENKKIFEIETLAGLMKVEINIQEKTNSQKEFVAKVNMGSPIFEPEKIPMNTELVKSSEFINESIGDFKSSALFMGTTHTVIYVDALEKVQLEKSGAEISSNKLFPKKTNVNFVQKLDDENIKMQTWERGAGLTFACGTGACASVVIGNMKLNILKKLVSVHLPLGILKIEIKEKEKEIYMTGPSEKIARGEYYYEKI